MSELIKIKDLADFIYDKHSLVADGCKSSCLTQEIGYRQAKLLDDNPIWYARFGGYCFKDMKRNEEITAQTLDELIILVKKRIENEIMKEY